MTTNFQDTVLMKVERIITAAGCEVPALVTPTSNFSDRLLELLDTLLDGLGQSAVYRPQTSEGDPNGVLTARWDRDLAIDVVNDELYYALTGDTTLWIALCPAPGGGGS